MIDHCAHMVEYYNNLAQQEPDDFTHGVLLNVAYEYSHDSTDFNQSFPDDAR